MKKALIGTALATGMMLSAPTVFAESGYIGITYQIYTLSVSGQNDLKPQGVGLVLGGSLNQYFKLEGRIGTNTKDANTMGQAITINNYQGVYLKGGKDVMNMVFPYIVAGFSKFDIASRANNYPTTESGASYGVGADFHYKRMQVGVEWLRMEDNSSFTADQVNVSAAWRF